MRQLHDGRARTGIERRVGDLGADGTADRAIAALAGRQLGVVTRGQLVAAGLGPGAIARRRRLGHLHPVHRGVYLVGHRALAPGARELAALHALGVGAVLSDVTAARWWRLLTPAGIEAEICVTVAGRNPGPRAGIRVRRTATLDVRDTRRLGLLRLTSPARTLVDLAAALPPRELEQALAQGERLRIVSRAEVRGALERAGRRRGVRRLRDLLAGDDPAFTRSQAEELLLGLIRRAELPRPLPNARIAGLEVDFLWPRERLVIEVDGYRYHGDRLAFEADRRRDALLGARGYRVLRFTWRQLRSEPHATVARVAMALGVASGGAAAPID